MLVKWNNKGYLRQTLLDKWVELPAERLQHLVPSMPAISDRFAHRQQQ